MISNNNINIIFRNENSDRILIQISLDKTIGDLIREYFRRIGKSNLIIKKLKYIKIKFLYEGRNLNNYEEVNIKKYLNNYSEINVIHEYSNNNKKIEIIEAIKENIFASVYKAKYGNQLVAIKKINKDKIKEEMKFVLCKREITESDFKPEIEKFNKEIENMELCHCENSVEIYDFYDTEKEVIIIMDLCDETLFHLLCDKPNGFSSKEIKEILLQLNNVFQKMIRYNISHRDIKLNNILVKYLDKEKTKYRVLLSDYGISNQLYSMTQKFSTHAGSQLIMAPEILDDEEYNNKCDLWSLGIIIFQLFTKKFPYNGTVEKAILKQIKKLGQSVLDEIDNKEQLLKDLLSRLLVRDPDKRISWELYFEHPFFK